MMKKRFELIIKLNFSTMKTIKLIIIFCSLLAVSNTNAQTGLLAHYSFENINNNQFIDHVTGELGGTVFGAGSVPGAVENALKFNGFGDFVSISDGNTEPPDFFADLSEGSISVWFRVDNIPAYGIRPIFYYGVKNACDFFDAANKGLIIEVGHSPIHNGSKRLYFTIWSNGCTYPSFCYDSRNPIVEGQWYHFVAVVGADFNTGYLDGQLMTDRRYNFGNTSTHEFFSDALSHQRLWLGKGYWDTNEMYFEGAIDEVKIFDKALNQEEINMLYAEGDLTAVSQNSDENAATFLFPNPARKTVSLDIPSTLDKTLDFKLYNNTGKLVFELKVSRLNQTKTIDISDLPKGLYVYSLSEGAQIIKTEKLVIQ